MNLILSFALSFAIFASSLPDTETTDDGNTRKWTIPRPDPSGCASDFSCIRYGKQLGPGIDCNGPDCFYMLAYRLPSAGEVELFLAAHSAQYVAVGFTPDLNSVNPVCVVCTRTKDKTVAFSLLNWTGSQFTDITVSDKKEMEGLESHVENDSLWCLVRLSALYNKPINMEEPFYQLYFWGDVDDSGKPKLVGENEKKPQNLTTSESALAFNRKHSLMSMLIHTGMGISDVNCSVFNCVGIRVTSLNDNMGSTECNYKNCSYLLAYEPKIRGTQVWSVFLGSVNAQFVAVGFTKDLKSQTDTEVIGCKKSRNRRIEAFNYRFSSPSQKDQPLKINNVVKFQQGSVSSDGSMSCNIERPLGPRGNAINLNSPVYLLYMWGSLDENEEPDLWDPKKNFNSTVEKLVTSGEHWTTFRTEYYVSSSSVKTVSWIVNFVVITLTLSVHL